MELMKQNRNSIRRKTLFVDKKGVLKAKKSRMHPTVLFTQQVILVIAICIAFILLLTTKSGAVSQLKESLHEIQSLIK
jgi:hypothetical protein